MEKNAFTYLARWKGIRNYARYARYAFKLSYT